MTGIIHNIIIDCVVTYEVYVCSLSGMSVYLGDILTLFLCALMYTLFATGVRE